MRAEYQRPKITFKSYEDDHGEPIPYGHRWDGSPSSESYSHTSNLQRFSPLCQVAEALVKWICERYKVRCFEDPGLPAHLRVRDEYVVRSVRLFPEDSKCAPIGVVVTNFPGIHIQLGTLYQASFPSCGCDACDEDVPGLLDELEEQIDAVLTGNFVELLNLKAQRLAHQFTVEGLGFAEQSRGIDDISPTQLSWARAAIPPGNHWAPWPAR